MSPTAVKQAIEEHWDAMCAVCISILRKDDDVAEVMSQAAANVWATPPPAACANVRAWLCRVVRNATYDFLRKRATARKHLAPLDSAGDRALPDQFLASDLSPRIGLLFSRAREFLGEDSRPQIDRYLKAELGQHTEAMTVEEETATREQLGDALFAAWLVDEPGKAAARCKKATKIVEGRLPSPKLLEEVMAHIAKCAICRRERKKPRGLLALALATLGIGVTAGMSTGKKVGVTLLAITAAAAVTLAGVTQRPYIMPIDAETRLPVPLPPSPPPPTAPTFIPPLPPPRQAPPPPGPPAEPTVSKQSPPPPLPPSSSLAEPSVVGSSPPKPVEREESPPTISDGWLERDEIAGSTCPDEPTTSEVRAVVTSSSEVAAVTAHLRSPVEDMVFVLTNGGRTWHGSIGPVANDNAHGRFDVVISAVGANGLRGEQRIGTIRITCCPTEHR